MGMARKGGWHGLYRLISLDGETCIVKMRYGPVKFRLTVVKPYNHDPDTDDPEDIVYTNAPARPGRLEVRIPAAAAPLAAVAPPAAISAAAISPSPSEPVWPLPVVKIIWVVSDVMINKDQEEAIVNAIDSNTIVINASFLTAKEQADLQLASQLRQEGKIITPRDPFEQSDRTEVEAL
ncbi:hypothetical protein UVI_02060700 [Ustilaginoidea virens]|uniref:Uncharacterized protein n=1 Tax=Ustilaginoidea virens TaxID=1159556 RepID=A0A1B5L9E5_USTVR|nr:hypothetical protein UVI_02060700 [Ustilaginoidea virens]